MKLLVVALVLVCTCVAVPADDFQTFKARFSKVYENDEDEQYHKQIFLSTKEYVDQHNSDSSSTYKLGINEFADIDPVIFAKERNGYLGYMNEESNNTQYFVSTGGALPTTVDWREKGVVTEIKNQGQCGSCWAFSTTGSLEGQHAIKTGNLVSLSEEQLIDCSRKEGNMGCTGGGSVIQAFEYIKKNGGIDTEASYPFMGGEGRECKFTKENIGATCTGYVQIKKKDCNSLKEAIAKIGPISVAMDASEMSFQRYESGIYEPKKCSSTKLDHSILAVGYGTEDGTAYWLVKNSWGKSWGMEGYFKIAVKDDLCGICTAASYPTV